MRADRLGWNGLGLATLGGLVELEVA